MAEASSIGPPTSLPMGGHEICLLDDALIDAASSPTASIITRCDPPFEITHVNGAWVDLCGYQPEEAIGRTCKILQGPDTSQESLEALHAAIAARQSTNVCILNYTKSKVCFLNHLFVQPLRESSTPGSPVTHYIGMIRAWREPEWREPEDLTSASAHAPQAFQTAEEEAKVCCAGLCARLPEAVLPALLCRLSA